MHVRMGDKACEMKVVEFQGYLHLANRIRKHFPHLNSVWLSTEMQVKPLNHFNLLNQLKWYKTQLYM